VLPEGCPDLEGDICLNAQEYYRPAFYKVDISPDGATCEILFESDKWIATRKVAGDGDVFQVLPYDNPTECTLMVRHKEKTSLVVSKVFTIFKFISDEPLFVQHTNIVLDRVYNFTFGQDDKGYLMAFSGATPEKDFRSSKLSKTLTGQFNVKVIPEFLPPGNLKADYFIKSNYTGPITSLAFTNILSSIVPDDFEKYGLSVWDFETNISIKTGVKIGDFPPEQVSQHNTKLPRAPGQFFDFDKIDETPLFYGSAKLKKSNNGYQLSASISSEITTNSEIFGPYDSGPWSGKKLSSFSLNGENLDSLIPFEMRFFGTNEGSRLLNGYEIIP
jgi:hypothetical protein